jgi:hypothetical protein
VHINHFGDQQSDASQHGNTRCWGPFRDAGRGLEPEGQDGCQQCWKRKCFKILGEGVLPAEPAFDIRGPVGSNSEMHLMGYTMILQSLESPLNTLIPRKHPDISSTLACPTV